MSRIIPQEQTRNKKNHCFDFKLNEFTKQTKFSMSRYIKDQIIQLLLQKKYSNKSYKFRFYIFSHLARG